MKELEERQYAAFWISARGTPWKSAQEALMPRVSWARGVAPGSKASVPAAWMASTIQREMESCDAGV